MGNYCSLSNHVLMMRGMDDNMLGVEIYIIIFHARYKKDALTDTFDICDRVEKIFVPSLERFELDV